jgi:hypothetical protein
MIDAAVEILISRICYDDEIDPGHPSPEFKLRCPVGCLCLFGRDT